MAALLKRDMTISRKRHTQKPWGYSLFIKCHGISRITLICSEHDSFELGIIWIGHVQFGWAQMKCAKFLEVRNCDVIATLRKESLKVLLWSKIYLSSFFDKSIVFILNPCHVKFQVLIPTRSTIISPTVYGFDCRHCKNWKWPRTT